MTSHTHIFELKAVKDPYYCERCNQQGFEICYSCDCNLFYHKECVGPTPMVKHPFFPECTLSFKKGTGRPDLIVWCNVCGDRIDEYHYECCCEVNQHRYAHPHCLNSCKPTTLEACNGLTMVLKKEATGRCLYCGEQEVLTGWVRGWAYVSPCGSYCYHSECVMKLIIQNWKIATMEQTRDPYEYIKERFAKDMYNLKKQMRKEDEKKIAEFKKIMKQQEMKTENKLREDEKKIAEYKKIMKQHEMEIEKKQREDEKKIAEYQKIIKQQEMEIQKKQAEMIKTVSQPVKVIAKNLVEVGFDVIKDMIIN